jgi:diguanylate cyclase (GGDEF)-like protein
MVDIDNFKALNDTYGHQAGDECLKRVAGALAETLRRAGDVAARYGGEEFAVILPATDAEGACVLAEEIRAGVHALGIPHQKSEHGVVTVSLGVASMVARETRAPEELVAAADRALYVSKNAGRNRISTADGEGTAHA